MHRARQLLVEERTALVNQVRGLVGEFGIVVAQGIAQLRRALPALLEDGDNGLPALAREVLADLQDRLRGLDQRIAQYDRRIEQLAQEMEAARRLMAIDGVGALTATAIVATVGDAKVFENGRQFAAWLGLTPRQYSSGGKSRLGHGAKRGDVYLRTLLIHGTRSVLRLSGQKTDGKSRWAQEIKQRRGNNIAAIALAAKHARIIWALLARATEYRVAA